MMQSIYRHEIKYESDFHKAEALRHKVRAVLRPDIFAGADGSYMVKSVYFDTPFNDDYLGKELGLQYRQKVRLRTYGDGGVYRMEIKSKNGELATKYSSFIDRKGAEKILKGDYSPLLDKEDSRSAYIYYQLMTRAYRPLLSVFYKRYAYTLPGTDLRLTFDENISYGVNPFAILTGHKPVAPVTYKTIIELKYGDFAPKWVSDIILAAGVSAGENSKYNRAFNNIFD